MTREEQIKQALSRYVKNRGVSGNHIVDVERDAAFIAGAIWADNNPDLSSLWHDANEEPKGTYIVLCDGLDNRQWVVDYLHIDMSYANWQDYADAISVSRWAYISDLLPKQFRNSLQLKGGEQ